ncbi:MAG: hypothetical protein A2234_04950, partial [Elusimicrobia bacterium RIFOXYA2_FULL_58_8]
EFQGHTVLLAIDGTEFMQKITDTKADLVISDINLPVFDGIELYRKTRALPAYADAPFILWSGVELLKGVALVEQDPKLRFLKKPFGLAMLQSVMDDLIPPPVSGEN